jgi:repressor LexA
MKPFDEAMLQITKEFIEEYQRRSGRAPSLRNIMHAYEKFYGVSISKVQRYVLELKKRGFINYGINEGIRSSINLQVGKTRPTSLIGECPCGEPVLAIENIIGTYALPEEIFGTSEHFMLRAKGYSMIEKGIIDGDIMVVRQQNWADFGDIVIARVNGEEATAKVYAKENNRFVLKPANSSLKKDGTAAYRTITPEGEWEILGVVDNIIHRTK